MYDDTVCHMSSSLDELEKRLFGLVRHNELEQEITDKDFIPIKCRLAEGVVRNAKLGLAHHHLQFAETVVIFN